MSAKNEGSASMRMFGAVIRALREPNGISTDELAAHVGYSKSLIIKIERGERMPPPDFIEKAEPLLGAGPVLRKAAEHLERSEFPSWFEEYAELERTAVSVYKYDTLVINGLLQTEDYARALFDGRCPVLDAEEIERRVQARMARQALLTRTPSAQTAFAIEEWVLRRPVGGPDVQGRQLIHLLEVGKQRSVTIQVLLTRYGAHAGVDGPLTLLETPERQLLAYLEVQARSMLIDDRDEVSELNQRYARIRSQALSLEDSAKLIEQIAGEL
ncbi:helix-turn-helix transcriptional regulator [Streptomyces sp. H10-C2]|uniref:helix-turn-helix domain-containing protein n=1 Tax=unclassified Streptomyces TaxID=2593676 RepID=UPI0024BB9276|nr:MULTISPECIES: helix-turn-helix transcriptional regulator [unclassified Streptomyces]MDJ0346986.1 helix-turn-helix transcriptional regulator [Streptomyces sp. PH10-H1]MDJ0375147.1 helix-turn-helix transcriptional regulator [Streptomyces sp. H10-C2]